MRWYVHSLSEEGGSQNLGATRLLIIIVVAGVQAQVLILRGGMVCLALTSAQKHGFLVLRAKSRAPMSKLLLAVSLTANIIPQ